MTPEQLKTWRKQNGYSQSQLAGALSVDIMTISRWEREVRAIPKFLHLALKWLEYEGKSRQRGRKGIKR